MALCDFALFCFVIQAKYVPRSPANLLVGFCAAGPPSCIPTTQPLVWTMLMRHLTVCVIYGRTRGTKCSDCPIFPPHFCIFVNVMFNRWVSISRLGSFTALTYSCILTSFTFEVVGFGLGKCGFVVTAGDRDRPCQRIR
jgi:hypothetical protein